jgi:hypothetical protein
MFCLIVPLKGKINNILKTLWCCFWHIFIYIICIIVTQYMQIESGWKRRFSRQAWFTLNSWTSCTTYSVHQLPKAACGANVVCLPRGGQGQLSWVASRSPSFSKGDPQPLR